MEREGPQGLLRHSSPINLMADKTGVPDRMLTRRELATYNGRDGHPMYVAYGGIVYDVTSSPLWAGGEHQFAHAAGDDLTEEMDVVPHGAEVFERFPAIGRLKD